MFSGTAGKGKAGGSGALSLRGHPHSARTAPHVCSAFCVEMLAMEIPSGRGKLELIDPRSERHNLLRNKPVSSLTIWRICLDDFVVPGTDTSTGRAPITVSFLPSAVRNVILLLIKHDLGILSFDRMLSPAQRVEQPVSAIPVTSILACWTDSGNCLFESCEISCLEVLSCTAKVSVLVRELGLCIQRFDFLSQYKSAVDMLLKTSSDFTVNSMWLPSSSSAVAASFLSPRSLSLLTLDLHTFLK